MASADSCLFGGRRSPGVPEAELLKTIPRSSMQHSSPVLASSCNRSVSASVSVVRQSSTSSAAAPPAVNRQASTGSTAAPPAVTRQISTGSGAAPPTVSFQPSTGAPSRSSAPVQGTVRAQLSSGMATQHRTSAGSLGPGREKRPGREPKAHSSDRFQPSRSSFRTSQNIAGGRPETPRGSKAANGKVLGPGTGVGKGMPSSSSTGSSGGQGAAMSQSNRGRFFPATVPLGSPAAVSATSTQQLSQLSPKLNRLVDGTAAGAPATLNHPVSHLSPKLNYRMAPAPSSDEESSPPPATENRGSAPDARKRKTKGPIVTL